DRAGGAVRLYVEPVPPHAGRGEAFRLGFGADARSRRARADRALAGNRRRGADARRLGAVRVEPLMVDHKTIADPATHYGSPKAATRGFKWQRITAALNIAFLAFLIWLVVSLAGGDRA